MTETDWQTVKEIFLAALEKDAAERDSYVAGVCNGDGRILAEVRSLLASHAENESFIETPAFQTRDVFESEDERVDQQFGAYTIKREIGRGGMGAVFLAKRSDGAFEQRVALKIVRQSIAESHLIERFKQERQILASLNHPNIAKLLDGGVSKTGEPFLAMEYIDGDLITDFASRQNFSVDDNLRLFTKVCSAVAYAHRNLVVHRDIKPGNILVTSDGEPKLLDFGLAKLTDPTLSSDPTQTQTAFRALTPAYSSPEQLRGDAITTSSDVYSLGVVLFELLTGKRPFKFEGRTLDEIIRTVTGSEPDLPSRVASSTSQLKGDLDNIILTALRNEPERRYRSVELFVDDIDRYLKGLPVAARQNTFKYRSGKFIRRHKIGVIAAVLIFMSVIGGFAATLWQTRVAANERDQARLEQVKSEQLNTFLQTILSSASPEESGKDAKVIDVLNIAADRVDSEFAEQPELRAQALLTIGKTFSKLSLMDNAEVVLRKALELSVATYGTENKTTASCMIYLATSRMSKGSLDEAEDLYLKGIEIERKVSDKGSKELALGQNGLGELYVRKSDYEKALPILRESISHYDGLFGANNPESAFVLISVGRAQSFSGDTTGAEATYRQALTAYQESPARYELRIAFIKINLGSVLVNRGEFEEGIALILEAEAIFARKQGDSFNTFISKSYLCRAYLLKGDLDDVIRNGLAGIDLGRSLKLEANSDFQLILENTGLAFTRKGDVQKGETLLREGLQLAASENLAGAPDAKGNLGENLTAQRRYAEAEQLLLESYADLQSSVGEQNPQTLAAKSRLDKLHGHATNSVSKP